MQVSLEKNVFDASGRRAAMSLRNVHLACGGTALQVYETPPLEPWKTIKGAALLLQIFSICACQDACNIVTRF